MYRSGLAISIVLTSLVPASAQTLDGAGIEEIITDKRVLLSTPYGLRLPLRYESDGSVTGDISGFSMASMFTPSETGRWWTEEDSMCQQFPTWYDGATFCFTIEKTGEDAIIWKRNDGLEGTATIE
ncbi:hypothetical protein GTW25_05220 [Aliihoeflea aestuarii]|uniref:hypothetical protein n=1 Tax=Aliihoeflea aestuarii TaxID=453840 RepID=UPI00209239A5|nr:hypothetical protein [Aliihoeflea aestuarii]MCO6390426.1 hypothetical protein [Aliihoeflea aestuarii]